MVERRKAFKARRLDDEQMTDEEIERMADRVFEKLQAQIGKNAIQVSMWAASLAVLAFLAWLGIVKVSHASQIAFHLNR